MLTIRKSQMDAFAVDLYLRFRATLVERICEAAQARGEQLSPAMAEDAVDAVIARAAEHGIVEREDLLALGGILAALGPAFDSDPRIPWAGFLFRLSGVLPRARLELIAAKARDMGVRVESQP